MSRLKTVSGKAINPIGIGTWGFGGTWETDKSNDTESVEAIRYSISKGQNHIDSAEVYGAGHTDEVIGQAIKGLKREDLFLTDKVWETHVASGKVKPAVKRMLKKLGTDYLDALYIHKPWADFPWREAIPQINDLIDEGVVRYFGASNFQLEHLEETKAASRQPVVFNQLYFNVVHKQEAGPELLGYCRENNIQVIAYRPLERGAVSDNPVVRAIAKKHDATAAQVALAWLLAKGAWPIPQSGKPEYADQNLAAAGLKLTEAEITQLDEV